MKQINIQLHLTNWILFPEVINKATMFNMTWLFFTIKINRK